MKIYTCLLNETPNVWHHQINASLRDMGHQVFTPVEIGLNQSWYRIGARCWSFHHRRELGRRLLNDVQRQLSATGLDLFLTYFFPFQFEPRIFRAIERLGIPTVLFYCDNLNNLAIAEGFARFFTLSWVPEIDAVPIYRKQKCDYIYLPMAANPNFNRPLVREETREVVFIGSKNPYRRWLLGELIDKGLPVEIYGPLWHPKSAYYGLDDTSGKVMPVLAPLSRIERLADLFAARKASVKFWLRYGIRPKALRRTVQNIGARFDTLVTSHASREPASHQRVMELFAESKVTLGINHYIDPGFTNIANLTYSRMRDFEAPMSGACYLTQYTRELDSFYTEPHTITTYRTAEELQRQAAMLLHDRDLREHIRHTARAYGLKHHTWQHRFRLLFERLGLREPLAEPERVGVR